ncbi:phospholipase D-like domain-containing protein [Nocardioides sp. CPCC 206347]
MKIVAAASLLVLGLLTGSGQVAGASAAPEASVASTTAATVPTWLPPVGPVFNTPNGTYEGRTAILKRVHDGIRNTPPGATIRFASYNIDRSDTATLLKAAKDRGVNVQIVVNANLIGPVEKGLQAKLGKNPRANSFLIICRNACRNGSRGGNMHMKTYTFSRAGAATSVVINSSANLSGGAVRGQWNDAYTVYGNHDLYRSFLAIFNQLKFDRAVSPRRMTYRTETLGVYYQRFAAPRESVRFTSSGDLALDRVRQIHCRTKPGFGASGKTVVRIAMYAWYGTRGVRIAKSVAARKREGCVVAVIGSVISKEVVRILKGSGISVKAADWDFGMKLSTGGEKQVYGTRCYSHLKVLTVDGTYKGRATKVVFTGSENWSAPALGSDEVTYEIHDPLVLRTYNLRWRAMWDNRNVTHRTGIEPKRRPCA